MLQLGFIADDLGMSVTAGKLALLHISVWSEIHSHIVWWLTNEGRFFPVPFFYSYLFFALDPSMQTEKIVQVAAVLVNVGTLFFVMRYVVGNRFAGIISLMFVACLQVRSWFDAIVAFFVLLPVTTEALLLCLWSLLVAIDRRSIAWTIVGSAFGTFALLSYEMTYPIVAAIGVYCAFVASARRWKLASLAGTLGPVVLLAGLDWALRRQAPVTNYAIGWGGAAYFRTFSEQFFAALPLSFATFTQHENVLSDFWNAGPSIYATTIVAAGLSYFVLRPTRPVHRHHLAATVILGVAFWVFPAAVIALSHALQVRADHGFGNGYLNVYLEVIGIAIVSGALVVRCLDAIRSQTLLHFSRVAVSALIGALVGFTGVQNERSFATYVPLWTTMRATLDNAFAAGLITPVVKDTSRGPSTLYWDSIYPLSAGGVPYEVYAQSHEAYDGLTLDVSKLHLGELCRFGPGATICLIHHSTWLLQATLTLLPTVMRLAGVQRNANGTLLPIFDRRYIASSQAEPTPVAESQVTHLLGTGPKRVYDISSCIGTTLADASKDADPANVFFTSGFSGREAAGRDTWRWSQSQATMRVTKALPVRARAELRMVLQTLGASRVTIDAPGSHLVLLTKAGAETPAAVSIDLRRSYSSEIRFHVSGGTLHAPGDSRELGLRVWAISLHEVCE